MPVVSDSPENDVAYSICVSSNSSYSDKEHESNHLSFRYDPEQSKHIDENNEPEYKGRSFKPQDDSKKLQDDESGHDDDFDQDVDECSDIEGVVKTDAYQRDYMRKQFKQTKSGRMVRRKTSSFFMSASRSPRDHQEKTHLIWMFTKMQDYEKLKIKYQAATDEISELKNKHMNQLTIKAAPQKTFQQIKDERKAR